MADRRRIVTIDAAGTVTTVADLENGSTFQSVRDSFTVKAPARKPIMAASSRRYGGARTVGESHDNGEIAWQVLVAGATADAALQNAELALGVIENAGLGTFLEWRPDGASSSTYYEVRGPGTWTPTYKWAQFAGARSMVIDIALPVAPLARGQAYDIAIPATVLPNTVALGSAILGDAPALADITLEHSGGADAPVFALIGWSKRPAAPLAGAQVPFGVIEADGAHRLSVINFADVSDAKYRGGNGLEMTAPAHAFAEVQWSIDPSALLPDDFAVNEVDVELWARVKVPAGIVLPRLFVSMFSGIDSTEFYPAEQRDYDLHGDPISRLVVGKTSGDGFFTTRLGTITMPVMPGAAVAHRLRLGVSCDPSSAGVMGVDYIIAVPARQRALSPTGKGFDGYPKFLRSTAALRKTIRSDLSAVIATAAAPAAFAPSPGLGGTPLELPPGNVDLVLKLSTMPPDDPIADGLSEQLAHSVTGKVRVTPRYWLAKGA